MKFYLSVSHSGYSLEVFDELKQCILREEAMMNIYLRTSKLIVRCFL